MSQSKSKPVALTIAGSDSGGGAGIQADLRTFAALGVYGTTAITCITAQNVKRISCIEPCSPKMVGAQIEAVFAQSAPKAVKTGMLYSTAIVREVVAFFKGHPGGPLVVDPVMVATSGRTLLQPGAARALQRDLLPLATLVTPNLSEVEFLVGSKIRTLEQLRAAAKAIHDSCGCAVLAKGGHLDGGNEAVDFLCTQDGEWMFTAPRIKGVVLHGTGCTYSAAITAWIARGCSLAKAVEMGKTHITAVIAAAAKGQPHK